VWDEAMQKVVPTWDPSLDPEATQATNDVVARLNAMNAGSDGTDALGLGVPVTFHPLGGCVMGQTTDLFGRVEGQPNLYVIDGSLIPGVTPLSNPFWTISANSERCIETILREDFQAVGA
jgi:cholesterol oxidase